MIIIDYYDARHYMRHTAFECSVMLTQGQGYQNTFVLSVVVIPGSSTQGHELFGYS
jgi:hypothetical protein